MPANSESDGGTGAGDGSVQPRKRRRVAVACRECRSRKSRCDGVRPQCTFCKSQGIACDYAQTTSAAGNLTSSQTILDALDTFEARLSRVEGDVVILKRYDFSNGGVTGRQSLLSEGHPSSAGSQAVDQPPYDDNAADTTDGTGTIEFTDVPNTAYFGPSSNIHFIRKLRGTLATLLRGLPQLSNGTYQGERLDRGLGDGQAQQILEVSRPQTPTTQRSRAAWPSAKLNTLSLQSLPPEDQILTLTRRYFSDTGRLFPFIHEESFYKSYYELKASGFCRARRSWVAVLYAILAMAAITTTSERGTTVDQRAADADVYLTRGKELSLSDTLVGAGVETVQALLLISQFLQGTKRSVQTWSIHGLAVKSALQLGLHSEDSLQRFGALEQEIRRRTWHGCVLLDRTLSMTFGRPGSIPGHYVKVALPSHQIPTRMRDEGLVWSDSETSTNFFNATITLYKIMCQAIDMLYGSNLGAMPTSNILELLSAIVDIEHAMLDWQASIPQSMQLINSEDLASADCTDPATRFRLILTLRYHNLRILVHRPILDYQLEQRQSYASPVSVGPSAPTGYLPPAGQRSLSILQSSANAIIDFVAVTTKPNSASKHLLGAWWFTLYYTFNAALAMAAVAICQHANPQDNSQGSPASVPAIRSVSTSLGCQILESKSRIDTAVACLPRIDPGNKMGEKCTSLTRALRSSIQLLLMLHTSHQSEPWAAVENVGRLAENTGEEDFTSHGNSAHFGDLQPWATLTSDVTYGMDFADFTTFMDGMMVPEMELPILDDIVW